MTSILTVSDLQTYFITKQEIIKAVNGVSFEIRAGETFGLVGESGCGKSVTCRSILRLIRPPGKILSGRVDYKGKNLLSCTEKEIQAVRGREIGMIFQEPMTAVNPVLKIKTQIYETFSRNGMSKQQKYARAVELMRLVGIPLPEQRLEEYAHQFSGGMRQRAMIAIALAAEPKILLADEPTTALDVTIQDQIIKLLNDLRQKLGMSVILVTHDLGVVAQMCDRVAVMYAGYIMEMANTLTLFATPRHPYTLGLINSLPHRKIRGSKLEPITGSPPDLAALPPGCPFVPRCTFKERRCEQELPEMQEIAPGHVCRCHYSERLKEMPGLIDLKEEPGTGGTTHE